MVDLESGDGMKFTHRFCLWAATEAIPPRRSQSRRSLKEHCNWRPPCRWSRDVAGDRKSTRLNSSHVAISYAVFCLKKKKTRGYAFKEWKGPFYPEDLKDAGMLVYYSSKFPTVEINNH